MKRLRTILIPFVLLAAGLFFLSGCLNNATNSFDSQVTLAMKIENFDSVMTTGSDTLRVSEVRFVFGDGSLTIDGDTTDFLTDPSSWGEIQFNVNNANPQAILRRLPTGNYSKYVLSIPQASSKSTQVETAFIGEKHYSMIIDGTFNDKSFTYKLSRSIRQSYPFSLQVPAKNKQAVLLISTDVKSWFSKSAGMFYNPKADSVHSKIGDNIEGSFTFTTQTNQ